MTGNAVGVRQNMGWHFIQASDTLVGPARHARAQRRNLGRDGFQHGVSLRY